MSEFVDKQLINILAATQRERFDGAPSFCLDTVWNAEPETAEGKEAQRELLGLIAPDEHRSFQCPVEGCTTSSYPKNPDYMSDEDKEINGGVYRPVDSQHCRIGEFCLKEAWTVHEDIESKDLRDAVRGGAYKYIEGVCDQVSGASPVAAFRCVALGCCLSAGFSEDGVGGTAGECHKEMSTETDPGAAFDEKVA